MVFRSDVMSLVVALYAIKVRLGLTRASTEVAERSRAAYGTNTHRREVLLRLASC